MIICIFLITLTCYQNPQETLVAIIFLLAGIPVYFILIVWKQKPKVFLNASSKTLKKKIN